MEYKVQNTNVQVSGPIQRCKMAIIGNHSSKISLKMATLLA